MRAQVFSATQSFALVEFRAASSWGLEVGVEFSTTRSFALVAYIS